MNPSSSSIAKTLLPLVAKEDPMSSQLSRRLREAAQQMQRKGQDYKDLLAKEATPQSIPAITFYKTNRDGSIVTLDSAGRAIALEDSAGKKLYKYLYNDANDTEPNRIELSDGSVFKKRVNSASRTDWIMESSNPQIADLEFFDAALSVGRDGSFAIKYKCQIASSIKREQVVREISYNARGKKTSELMKTSCVRVGPGNAVTVKEIYVRPNHRL